MKVTTKNRLISLVLVGSFALLNAPNAFAAAGDPISNTATLGYSVGGTPQTIIESSGGAGNTNPGVGNGTATTFVEDRVLSFSVTRGGSTSSVSPKGTLQATEFTLLNTGNANQGFLLKGLNNNDGTADPQGGSADAFDVTTVQTFIESGANAGYQSAEDTVAFVASLAPNTPLVVYVVSTVPEFRTDGTTALVNADTSVLTLVAQIANDASTGVAGDAIVIDDNNHASPGGTGFTNGGADVTAGVAVPAIDDDPTTEEVVFGDLSGTQAGDATADAASNGQHSDDNSYTIQTTTLNVLKVSTVLWDPVNLNSKPKTFPGSFVRYTITINNTGAVAATLTTISDVLTTTLMDTVFSDGGAANASLPAAGTNNVRIVDGVGATTFCTANGSAADGCTYAGSVGDTVLIDLGVAAGTAVLAAGQSLTVEFNAIVQ